MKPWAKQDVNRRRLGGLFSPYINRPLESGILDCGSEKGKRFKNTDVGGSGEHKNTQMVGKTNQSAHGAHALIYHGSDNLGRRVSLYSGKSDQAAWKSIP